MPRKMSASRYRKACRAKGCYRQRPPGQSFCGPCWKEILALPAEWTAVDWAARPEILTSSRVRVRHDGCDGETQCGHVFRCRGEDSCGRFVGACFGGDGDLCNDCWSKLERRRDAEKKRRDTVTQRAIAEMNATLEQMP